MYLGEVLEFIVFSSHIQRYFKVLYMLVSWTSKCLPGPSLSALNPRGTEAKDCRVFKWKWTAAKCSEMSSGSRIGKLGSVIRRSLWFCKRKLRSFISQLHLMSSLKFDISILSSLWILDSVCKYFIMNCLIIIHKYWLVFLCSIGLFLLSAVFALRKIFTYFIKKSMA